MAKTSNVNVGAVGLALAAAEEATTNAVKAAQARLSEIETEIETLEAESKTLRGQIKGFGGKTRSRSASGPRVKNDMTLHAAVAQTLANATAPMSPTEIITAVQALGYKSNSENFRTQVSVALTKLSNLAIGKKNIAVNVSRGQWAAGSQTAIKAYLANPDSATAVASE